jgi:hypothetical protein
MGRTWHDVRPLAAREAIDAAQHVVVGLAAIFLGRLTTKQVGGYSYRKSSADGWTTALG